MSFVGIFASLLPCLSVMFWEDFLHVSSNLLSKLYYIYGISFIYMSSSLSSEYSFLFICFLLLICNIVFVCISLGKFNRGILK